MAIVNEGAWDSYTTGTTAATTTVTAPAEGELILLHLFCFNSGVTLPSGFTVINSYDYSANYKFRVAYKYAGASEPSSYTSTLATSGSAVQAITTYSGVDDTNPYDVEANKTVTSGASHVFPAVTTTVDDCLLVCADRWIFGAFTADDTDFTELSNNSGGTYKQYVGTKVHATAGLNTGDANATSGNYSTHVTALQPATVNSVSAGTDSLTLTPYNAGVSVGAVPIYATTQALSLTTSNQSVRANIDTNVTASQPVPPDDLPSLDSWNAQGTATINNGVLSFTASTYSRAYIPAQPITLGVPIYIGITVSNYSVGGTVYVSITSTDQPNTYTSNPVTITGNGYYEAGVINPNSTTTGVVSVAVAAAPAETFDITGVHKIKKLTLTPSDQSVQADTGTSVTATAANLTLASQDATVQADTSTSVTATAATLALASQDATVQTNTDTVVTATAANLTLASQNQSVQADTDTVVTATAANLTLASQDATVQTNTDTVVTATAANLTLASQNQSVQADTDTVVTATAANLTLASQDATVQTNTDTVVTATAANLTLASQDVTVQTNTDTVVTATAASLTLASQDATVQASTNTVVTATAASLTLTPQDATVQASVDTNVTAGTANLVITPSAQQVSRNANITASAANLTLVVSNPTVKTNTDTNVSAGTANLTLVASAQTVSANKNLFISATTDSLTLTPVAQGVHLDIPDMVQLGGYIHTNPVLSGQISTAYARLTITGTVVTKARLSGEPFDYLEAA